jgi:TRAP-type mannitol/chloroaromatic compound transport system permease small subunit
MERLIKLINKINDIIGNIIKWLVVALILVVSIDVFMRYVLNKPTLWGYDMAVMIGACMYTLGLAYVEKNRGNVRVDVLSAKMSEKVKIILDSVANILVFLPTYFLLTWYFWQNAIYSFKVGQKAITSSWYPFLWPVKIIIAIGFSMFIIQLFVNVINDLIKLRQKVL